MALLMQVTICVFHPQGTASLEGQLGEEQKKVKDLTSEKVKLNSIVKMGQDALRQEQDLVRQLQEQLNKKVGQRSDNCRSSSIKRWVSGKRRVYDNRRGSCLQA